MSNITIRNLSKLDRLQLFETFQQAFDDYQVRIELSYQDFLFRLNRLGIEEEISVGAFIEGEMVGFIMNSSGFFNGKVTIYNGGTGVIPAFRNKGLGKKMYNYQLQKSRDQHFQQALLEVITENDVAFSVYQKLGFSISRRLKSYVLPKRQLKQIKLTSEYSIYEAEKHNWIEYSNLIDVKPSWQNELTAIWRSLEREKIFEAYHKTVFIGFISFDPINGRVSQIAVKESYRRNGIASSLLYKAKKLMRSKQIVFLNLDETNRSSVQCFLEKHHFENALDQYEMILEIK